jgi:hypothetical protein
LPHYLTLKIFLNVLAGSVLRATDHTQLPGGQGLGLVAALAGHQAQSQELKVRRDQGNGRKRHFPTKLLDFLNLSILGDA